MQYCVHANISAMYCFGMFAAAVRHKLHPRFERSRLLLPRAARREEANLASDHR
jgi:hypothetical protein